MLRDCLVRKQPVYIFLPINKTEDPVPASALKKTINVSPSIDRDKEKAANDAICAALYSAKNASVLVDYLAKVYARAETRALVQKLDLPHYLSHMGQGCIDESNPRYVGAYNGAISVPGVADAIESSDLIVSIGWLGSDTNTAFFSRKIPVEKNIDIWPEHVTVSFASNLSLMTRLITII